MENILKAIEQKKLINKGETIGVGVSGGQDSMALLTYLCRLQQELDFEVVAIHIDHSLREASAQDALFVLNYCKKNHIRAYKFKIDVKELSKENGTSLETAAREARFGVFESLIKKGIVDKIALAHHAEDQAETILLHLFRGSGISGARGMEFFKKAMYIRPMLQTRKQQIIKYITDNEIPYVTDESNSEDIFQRNFIRNKILPLILTRFPSAINALNSFAKACKEDDDFISSQVLEDALIVENKKTVKIPCAYFLNSPSLFSRLVFKALEMIGVFQDVERKHIDLIKNLALESQNGSKIKLPMQVSVHKEYDFLTITNEYKEVEKLNINFKCGSFEAKNFGKVIIKKEQNLIVDENSLIVDAKKLPKGVVWRYKREGDFIVKFGGGTQKIKTYLSQKKIPLRLREYIPVLALNNEIYVVAGYGISDKIKVDETTKFGYRIKTL